MPCQKCNLGIAMNELPVICKGFCTEGHQYHAKCVGLSGLEHHALYHQNIFWMCDSCRDLMLNSKFRNTVNGLTTVKCNTETEVEDLRNEVSKLNESVNSFIETFRQAEAGTSCISPNPNDTSVILSSSKLHQEEHEENVRTSASTNAPPKLKLHLSNIANDVTEPEVAEMVADVLKIQYRPAVQLLVPSWKDKSSLAFVSFKVEIDVSLKSTALRTSRWPSGIRCREFVNYSRDVWRPLNRSI